LIRGRIPFPRINKTRRGVPQKKKKALPRKKGAEYADRTCHRSEKTGGDIKEEQFLRKKAAHTPRREKLFVIREESPDTRLSREEGSH